MKSGQDTVKHFYKDMIWAAIAYPMSPQIFDKGMKEMLFLRGLVQM